MSNMVTFIKTEPFVKIHLQQWLEQRPTILLTESMQMSIFDE